MAFNIPNIDYETESCLYKLSYGDKYIISKGKTLAGSIYLIEKGYAYFVAGGGGTGWDNKTGEGHKEGDGKNTYYHKFYAYINKNPKLDFKLEVLLETNNGYKLLMAEQIELNKAFKDKNLLNNNIEAYIPKRRFTDTLPGYHGWISRSQVLAFKRWVKRL